MRDLQYVYPSVAYLLLFVILFAPLFWILYEWRKRVVRGFAHDSCLVKLLIPRSRLYYLIKSCLILSAWSLATLALMQPRGSGRYLSQNGENETMRQTVLEQGEKEGEQVSVRRKAHDVIFLLDASASMGVPDARGQKRRLDLAKEIVDEIVAKLDGQAVALYAFTSEATPVVPQTHDYLFFRLALRKVGINEGDVAGTDLVEALETIKAKHFGQSKLKTLVLLSDGGDTRLEPLQGEKRDAELQTILSRLGDPQKEDLKVFTVGLGSKEGERIPGVTFEGKPVKSSLDEQLLRALSQKGEGVYYFANSYSTLAIAGDILKRMERDNPYVDEKTVSQRVGRVERLIQDAGEPEVVYELYFQWPCGLAILALAIYLILPDIRKGGRKLP